MNSRELSSSLPDELARSRERRHKSAMVVTRVADFFRDHSPEVLAALALIAGTASGWHFSSMGSSFGLLLLAAALTLVAGVQAHRRAKKISQLEDFASSLQEEASKERETVRQVLEVVAIQFLKEQGYWEGSTARLSVYGHVEKRFFLICRVSNNPSLAQRHRPSYPDDQGHIGMVWRKQKVLELGLQKATAHKKALELGMPEQVLKGLSMIPRGMAGHRIDVGDVPVGIVLIESELPHEIDDALDQMEASRVYKVLSRMVGSLENLFEPLGTDE